MKQIVDFIKHNAKILFLIYIAVMISVVAVRQSKINKQINILANSQVAIYGIYDDFHKEMVEAFKIMAEEIINSRKIDMIAMETNATMLSEVYMSVEKDPAKLKNFCNRIDKIINNIDKKPAKELTDAQKMGKKIGKDTVEMMKAMEDELHKAGYPW